MTIENFALVDFRGSRFVCGAALDNLLKIFTFQSHLKSDWVDPDFVDTELRAIGTVQRR